MVKTNMIVTPIHTKKVVVGDTLEQILIDSLPALKENSVVVITSKIVSLCEKSTAPITENKEKLIQQEADMVFENEKTDKEFRLLLTVKNNMFVPWAGIDTSNSNNHYVLWPKNPMKSAEDIWYFLKKTYNLTHVGVIIADSTFLPFRTGSLSIGLSWCGFQPVQSHIGEKDVFGKVLRYTTTNFVDPLAVTAGITMGEAGEQQPVAVITEVPGMVFVNRVPSKEEIASVHYPIEKDLFGPLTKTIVWKKKN